MAKEIAVAVIATSLKSWDTFLANVYEELLRNNRQHSIHSLLAEKLISEEIWNTHEGIKEGVVDTDTPLEESDAIIDALQNYRISTTNGYAAIIEMSSRDEFYMDITGLFFTSSFCQNCSEMTPCQKIPPSNDFIALTSDRKTFISNHQCEWVTVMEGKIEALSANELLRRFEEVLESQEYDSRCEILLASGAIEAKKIMGFIKKLTTFDVSIGVGHNKLTAKLACSRNKPQGILILPSTAITRLQNEMNFQQLPNYKGLTGKKLRVEYESKTRDKLETLADVLRVNKSVLVNLFEEIRVPFPVSQANDLITKCSLFDSEPVQLRLYRSTVNLSMSFKGVHAVYSWKSFRNKIEAFGRLFKHKVHYRSRVHKRLTTYYLVKATLKPGSRGFHGTNSVMIRDTLPGEEEIYQFIMRYINTSKINFSDIQLINVTRSKLIPTPEVPCPPTKAETLAVLSRLDDYQASGEGTHIDKQIFDMPGCRYVTSVLNTTQQDSMPTHNLLCFLHRINNIVAE